MVRWLTTLMEREPLRASLGGLKEAPKSGKDHTPYVQGPVVRQKNAEPTIKQAGERYRLERDDLILNPR